MRSFWKNDWGKSWRHCRCRGATWLANTKVCGFTPLDNDMVLPSTKRVWLKSNGEMVTKHNIPPFYVVAKASDKKPVGSWLWSSGKIKTFQLRDFHAIDPSIDMSLITEPHIRIRHGGELTSLQTWKTGCSFLASNVSRGNSWNFWGAVRTIYQKTEEYYICLGAGIIAVWLFLFCRSNYSHSSVDLT